MVRPASSALLLWLVLIAALAPAPARASCGAESCPLDMSASGSMGRRFSFDVAYQYVLQDRVLVGTRRGTVGELSSPEDEVKTESRTINLLGQAQFSARFGATAMLPYIDRVHEHVSNEDPLNPELVEWRYHGVGDLTLLGQAIATRPAREGTMVSFQLGAKLPTGRRHVVPEGEEEPEPGARPGTGSVDALAGVHVMRSVHMPWRANGGANTPVFVSVLLRANGRGTDDYRVGNELQTSLGANYTLAPSVEFSLQLNGRFRGMDDVGLTDALRDNTGGQAIYASPGLRMRMGGGVSAYAIAQLPVYQRVNRIQIVAPYHLMIGTTFERGR
jgi:hypothetical protein